MNAILDTTPAWLFLIESLTILKTSGRLVVNAIRKESSDIEKLIKLVYQDHLWMEKEMKAVANIRQDVAEFLLVVAISNWPGSDIAFLRKCQ